MCLVYQGCIFVLPQLSVRSKGFAMDSLIDYHSVNQWCDRNSVFLLLQSVPYDGFLFLKYTLLTAASLVKQTVMVGNNQRKIQLPLQSDMQLHLLPNSFWSVGYQDGQQRIAPRNYMLTQQRTHWTETDRILIHYYLQELLRIT